MAALDDQFIARKSTVGEPAFAIIFRQSADLVTGQSLRSLLGH
jgi:hypothetical protein